MLLVRVSVMHTSQGVTVLAACVKHERIIGHLLLVPPTDTVFLAFDFTARLCMLQSAVPFSMTCAFLPPQWVTVSLPLVYGCVTK